MRPPLPACFHRLSYSFEIVHRQVTALIASLNGFRRFLRFCVARVSKSCRVLRVVPAPCSLERANLLTGFERRRGEVLS